MLLEEKKKTVLSNSLVWPYKLIVVGDFLDIWSQIDLIFPKIYKNII